MAGILKGFFNKNPFTGDALKFISHYPQYRQKYKFLKKSEWWSSDNLKDYQFFQLIKLLNHAYENVPYYTDLFDEHKINIKNFKSLNDIQKIPFITKDKIKKNLDVLRAKNYPKHTFEYVTSGGTTDYPLGIYFERGAAEAKFSAFYQRMLDQSNCSILNKQAFLMSEDFLGDDRIYKYQLFRRILYLSSFHLTDEDFKIYIKKLKQHKPRYLVGFPSAMFQFAKYMENNDIVPFSNLKMIICSGETLYDWQRKKLEEIFKQKVYSLYSHNEQTVFATTCNCSNYYHIQPEYGVTELINKNGSYITKENEPGEIIGTGFNNYIFPLIRYKTGDFGIYTSKKCKCGRKFPLLKNIQGHLYTQIVTKKNSFMPISDFLNIIANCLENVRDWQLVQENKDEIILKIIRDCKYSNKDEQNIWEKIKNKFSDEIKINIQYVDNIPLASSGKKIFFIQKFF